MNLQMWTSKQFSHMYVCGSHEKQIKLIPLNGGEASVHRRSRRIISTQS